jgi:tetratricopeptide (TPR) repeat protein
MAEPARRGPGATEEGRLRREHVVPALRLFLLSRDLSPLRAEIHMILADHVDEFVAAEPRGAYLERAKLLAPADPDLWYRCGLHELADGRPDRAWASWRRALELSGEQLGPILDRSREHLGAPEILRGVLPDRPELLLEAARYLYPRQDEEQGRRPFLERALTLLEAGPSPPPASALHRRATIQRDLRRPSPALESYRQALLQEPDRFEWRYEYAELAYEQGRYDEAHQALLTILALQPSNERARGLLDSVARGLAEHR